MARPCSRSSPTCSALDGPVRLSPTVAAMCRNITTLRGLEPVATTEEIEAAARRGRVSEALLVAAQARLDALDQQIADYREKLSGLELLSTELQRLQNDVVNKREAHQTYLQKEEEARFSSSLDESGIVNLSVFERAAVPISPEASKAKVLMGAGLLVGLVIGVVLALVRDFVDPSVKGSAQAFRLSQTPILAEVPKV